MIPARKPLPFPSAFAAAALALSAVACSEPAGLRVDVNLGAFKDALSLEIVIAAAPGGFVKQGAENAGGATVTTEDVDGDGTYDLVTKFNGPFPSGSVSFLVTTGNRDALTMHGQALAFDAASLRAGAEGDAPLPAGGRGTLALTLEARPPGPIGPGTRSTDLLTAPADVTINGPSMDAQASAIAVCDLNGDKKLDVVIGVPGAAPNAALGPTGAVYVVFGDGGATETITLAPGDQSQFLFYGLDGGDRLGAAVACADLDADGVDDLIVGAPNAGGGVGRVYAVLGRSGLNLRSIDLASPTSDHLPDATWTATGANAGFGAALFALDFDADNRAEILVSAPGAKKVHLLTHLPTTTAPVDADQADHPTFSGVAATALAAGDLDGTGSTPDVILGDPTYIATNETTSRGIVYLFANVAPATPTAFDVTASDQTGPTTTMVGDKGTGFGAAVLALDTTGYQPDLFVGAPNTGADGRGLVYVYEHQDTFFLAKTRSITEFKTTLDGGVPGAHFGSALGASRSGAKAAPSWRLLVGAPDAPRGARTGAGAAYLLGGGVARGFPVLELVYGAAAGDRLGTAVAGGQIDAADSIGDLVTVAPFATGADTRSGVVYVRFGRP